MAFSFIFNIGRDESRWAVRVFFAKQVSAPEMTRVRAATFRTKLFSFSRFLGGARNITISRGAAEATRPSGVTAVVRPRV